MNRIQLLLLAGFSFAATNVYGQKNDAQATITASEAAKIQDPVLVTENQNIMTSQEMVALQSNRGQSVTPGNKQPVQVQYDPLTPSRETMGKDLRQNMSQSGHKPE
jgi:hypothetical protein